jgi:aminoglycoside phosphotransferase (APT) family kinase protein
VLRDDGTSILSTITGETVESYLRKRLDSSLVVRGIRRVPVGLSRQTWFVDLGSKHLVVRIDNPGGISAVPGSLQHEYDLYLLLSETALPVAAPLWFEADPAILGAPFYIREYVEGNPSPDHFDDPDPRYDDARVEASKEHARKLALVHSLDWGGLGLGRVLTVPPSPAECATTTVDRIAAGMRGVATEPMPVLEMITRWLRDHAPPSPVTALCKGSNGAMQEIWDGLTIVGLSDWELASIGDPANDWGRCHGYLVEIPGRWNTRCTLDYYSTLTGHEVSDEAIEYYRLIYIFEMILVGLHSGRVLYEGDQPDARVAALAPTTVRSGLVRLARAIGLSPAGVGAKGKPDER